MKYCKFLCAVFFLSIVIQGKAQDPYQYYESLWDSNEVNISSIEKKVDSLIGIYERKGEVLISIKMAHEFSRKLYRESLYKKGIHYVEYELSLYRKLNLENKKYAKALYNLGLFHALMGNFEKSKIAYQEVINVNTDDYSTAKAFCELGKYYYEKGDFFKSNDYYSRGTLGLEKFDKKKLLIKKYIAYSRVLYEMGTKYSLDQMLKVLNKANLAFQQVPNYSLLDYRALNNAYAIYYTEIGSFDVKKAKYYCFRNLANALHENDSTHTYASYTVLGEVYGNINNKKNRDSTLYFLNNALKYTRDNNEKSIVFHQYSNYYLANKAYEDALVMIHKSLIESAHLDQNVEALPSLNDLKISDNQYYILLALIQKATIFIQLYKEDENLDYIELALSNLLSADKLVTLLISDSAEEDSRLHWRKEASEIYLKGVLVSQILNNKERGFYFSEKKKALLLIEDIQRNTNKLQLPDAILKQENDLKKQILDLENRIASKRDNSGVLESKRFELKQKYQRQEDSVQKIFPDYYKEKETTKIVSLQKVQETIDDNSIILSYVSNKDQDNDAFSVLYAVLISNTETEIIKIGQLEPIEKLIKAYRNQLSKPFETKEDRIAFIETAFELYSLLIPKDKISLPLSDQKNLVIIPDGTLQYIPFESLIVDKGTNRYLIEDYKISYGYSMSFLQHNAKVQRKPVQDIVAFAPVTFVHNDLDEIVNSVNEVTSIGADISLNRYLKEEASKQNFLSKTKDSKIIHLATHANFSDNLQIAFHDTNLEYHELYTSKNQAELVVLSACNTSLGEIADGEGVLSLARGFFYAGANTVVSTFWNANDKSTAIIMESFYKNLKAGQTKSQALHNAKRDYIDIQSLSDASPYYWATFVLIGDAETILFPSNTLFYWIILSLLLIMIISVLVFFFKKR